MMENSSYLMWKIVGGEDRAQNVFDDIVKSAMLYRFKNFKSGAFPVDPFLTDAIFGLNSHDEVPLPMYGSKINGQKLKELFITTIFAKAMQENGRYNGKAMFITLPIKDEGGDVGIFSVDPDGYKIDKEGFIVMAKETEAAIFQVKEYVDYEKLKSSRIIVNEPIDPKFFHIDKLKTYSEEVILIYIRDARVFNTLDLKEALKELKGKKVYVLLSFNANIPQGDGTVIKLMPNCYNFLIIDVWANPDTVLHVWYKEPESFKRIKI